MLQMWPPPPTWQTGFLGSEQVPQSHRLKLLLQAETVLHPEARDVDGHRGLLHFLQPAIQLVQVQSLHYLDAHTNSNEQASRHPDVSTWNSRRFTPD